MGMFDYFRSSYDLGPHCTEVECQTKDMEDSLGGTMSQYWLDPAGYLYLIDYSHTADFIELKEDDEDYQKGRLSFLNFKWVPNGTRGKVTPYLLTKYIEIYPSEWDGPWKERPTLRLHMKYGRLMGYDDVTYKRKSL